MKKIVTVLFIALAVFSGCEQDNDPGGGPDLKKIASAVAANGDITVDLYSQSDTLFVGYNKLFLSLSREARITEAQLNLSPIMNMVDKKHSAPFENPGSLSNEDGFFEAAVVFIMPSNPDEGWVLNVDILAGDVETTAELQIPRVKTLDEPRLIRFPSKADGTLYFLSCVEPADPQVGINPCEFTVHYKESMMNFPAAVDLTMEIEPEMPSMEHGSPNNEDPVHTGNGHYQGKLNFTMTGWWRIHLTLRKGLDLVCDDRYMDITL